MTFVRALINILREEFGNVSGPPSNFRVDYYVSTPGGSSSRFTRRSGVNQIPGNARSETAVLSYLRRLHPGTDVQINDLEFY